MSLERLSAANSAFIAWQWEPNQSQHVTGLSDAGGRPVGPSDFMRRLRGPGKSPMLAFEASAATAPNQTDAMNPTASRIWSVAPGIWLLGAVVVFGRSIVSLVRLRRLLQHSRVADRELVAAMNACRIEMGVSRQVGLIVTDAETAPALAGVMRPRIVVSKEMLNSLDRDELRCLFRHELAHVRRSDVPVQLLWRFARALHWFNPLVWWTGSRAYVDAELACDEAALRGTTPSEQLSYGNVLLKVAEFFSNSRPIPGAVGLLVREPVLTQRIRAIAAYQHPSRVGIATATAIAIGLACVGLTGAINHPAEATEPRLPSNDSNQGPPAGRTAVSPVAQDRQTALQTSDKLKAASDSYAPDDQIARRRRAKVDAGRRIRLFV